MPRGPLQLLAFAALLPLGIGWSPSVSAQVSDSSRSPSDARDLADRIGVMTHFAHGWDLDILPRLTATGVRHVRDEIYWDHVENERGRFVFPPRFERYMTALRNEGIRPLVPLTFENRHYDGGLTPHTEAGFQAYARYCVEVVRHYGNQIQAVEIWNEYNGGFAKGPATEDRVGTYTRMLRRAYAALKRERPDLVVLGGSTAGLPFPYIERLAEAGALDAMDALSIHPYRESDPPESLEPAIRRLQGILARHSPKRPIPIWVTELGWVARPPGERSGPGVDEDTQADYLVRSFALLLSAGAERVYWYQLREHGVDVGLGLLRSDKGYTPKPAYAAFTTLLARLKGVRALVREPAPEGVYSFRLERAGSADEVTRLLWSVTPQTLPSLGAKRVVRIDGNTEPASEQISLSGTPLFLEGASSSPLPADSARGGTDASVPGSDAGFSLHQGANNWSYGTLILAAGEAAVFTPATKHRVTDWKEEWIIPETPWSVSAEEQHPSVMAGRPVAAVRRWSSREGGPVRVRARFNHVGKQGDGVGVRILVDGRMRFSKHIGGPNEPACDFDFQCTLARDGFIDFAVDPGPGGSPDYDATRVSIFLQPNTRP
jgi:hypothetical protein